MFSKDKLNLPEIDFLFFLSHDFSEFSKFFSFQMSSLKDIFKFDLNIISRSQIYCQRLLDLSDGTFTVRPRYK